MPVHGWRSFVHESIYLLGKWGMKSDRILHPETGQKFVYNPVSQLWKMGEKVPCQTVYIDGCTIGETDAEVLEERSRLAENGVVWVSVRAQNDGSFGEPAIGSGGVMNISARQSLVRDIRREVMTALTRSRGGRIMDVKTGVRKAVSRVIEKEIGKEPVVIVEVV